MQEAIKRATGAGYKNWAIRYTDTDIEPYLYPDFRAVVLFDPLFWQALGKAGGWNDETKDLSEFYKDGMGYILDENGEIPTWQYRWHQLIDHLAEGKDIDSFFNELLKKKVIGKFMECETCNLKPGSPFLCKGCVANRETISKLNDQ